MDEVGDTPEAPTATTSSDEATSEVDRSSAVPESSRAWPGFPEFYHKQTPRVIAFLMTLGADKENAIGITQDAMAVTSKNWNDITSHKAYVRKIASRMWARVLSKPTYKEVDLAEIEEEYSDTADPLHFVIRRAEHLAVLSRLRRLPLRQRQVTAWRYDGYTPTEIADILDIDVRAVRANLHKARMNLKLMREEDQ